MSKSENSELSLKEILIKVLTEYGKFFLVVLSVFTIIFLFYLTYAHLIFRKSQETIKQCYAGHIIKADSLYAHLLNYNKDVAIIEQKTNDAILADSLIKSALLNTQHLSKAQSKKLQFIIESHFNEIEKLHNKYEDKLSRDSLRLCTERELLDGQTKAMIDLHLNKVEHEYSNITIWGAVLTILFLVFSFYSLYKIDELIKQGQDGVDKINQIKTDGEKSVKQFEAEKQKIVNDTNQQFLETIKTISNDQQQKFSDFNGQLEKQIDNTKKRLDNLSDKIFDDFAKKSADTIKTYEDSYKSKQEEFNQLIQQAKTILDELKIK